MRPLLALCVSILLITGFTASDAVAAPLDPLSVTTMEASESSITFEIAAGASGAPNGIWLEWISKADYDAGGWGAYAVYCTFTGVPTYNTTGTATSYQLGSGQTIWVEIGDVFDETGMWASYDDELVDGTEYVVRAYAMGGAGWDASGWTSEIFEFTLTSPPNDCIHSQGYWKNHEEDWPVAGLTLGTVAYTKAQLLSILNQPAQGNGLVILAHQLIAAKLNVANGANIPGTVATAISDADTMIGALVVPPVGGGYLDPSFVNAVKNTLDSFNNGTGGGNCDPVPVTPTTWGDIKSTYGQN